MTFNEDSALLGTISHAARGPDLKRPSALLSLEASGRETRRLRSWSTADQARLVGAVQTALEQWEGAWGLTSDGAQQGGPARIRCQAASEAAREAGWPALRWDILANQDQIDGVWGALRSETRAVSPVSDRKITVSRAPRRVPDELHLALFNEASTTTSGAPRLADDLAQAAWSDWRSRMASLFAADGGVARGAGPSSPENAPGALSAPWSGALVLTLPWCGANLTLLLAAEAIAAFLGRPASAAPVRAIDKKPASLTPILQVVRSEPLSLRLEMAEVEVDLGTLASLRLGDVLRTSHRLDAPLMLTSAEPAGQQGRSVICTGFLGKDGDRRAIELLPHTKPS